MKIREINLLFAEIVFTKILNQLSNDELNKINDVLKNLDYHKTGGGTPVKNYLSSISKNLYILDLPELKKLADIIKDEFNNFKNNTLKYTYNDFVYTTSWATKCEPGQESYLHNHSNCFYSGVFYTDVNSDSGKLYLSSMKKNNFLLKKSEKTDYNSDSINVTTLKKMVIFFPSNLHHKINFNNSNITRYSIAFNFIPTGDLGLDDSRLVLKQ